MDAFVRTGETETVQDALVGFRLAAGDNPRYQIPYRQAAAMLAGFNVQA
jgi:hypothetical protein